MNENQPNIQIINLDELNAPETDRQKAIREMGVLLHYGWANPKADWFYADLYRLCSHADSSNLMRIAEGFPDAVEVFRHWKRTGQVLEA